MNFEIFSIFFWNLFYVSTSIFKSGKPNSNFLSPENWPHIFKFRKSEKPCMENSAKNSEKSPQSMFKTRFGHFWRRLWSIWNFENFLIFFEIFQNPTLHGTRGNFFSKKMPQNMFKTSLDNFGNNSGIFCFFEFSLIFFAKTFDDSMEHWAKIFFEKIAPKHFWTLGNDFEQF